MFTCEIRPITDQKYIIQTSYLTFESYETVYIANCSHLLSVPACAPSKKNKYKTNPCKFINIIVNQLKRQLCIWAIN